MGRYQEGYMNPVARINFQILKSDPWCVTVLMQCRWVQEELPSVADQEVLPVQSSKLNATDSNTLSLKYCQNVISTYHRSSRVVPAWRISNRLCGVFCLWHDQRAQRGNIMFIAFPTVMLIGFQAIGERTYREELINGRQSLLEKSAIRDSESRR